MRIMTPIPDWFKEELLNDYGNGGFELDDDGRYYEYTEQDVYVQLHKRVSAYVIKYERERTELRNKLGLKPWE
jgi:hypothetical protein